MADNTFGHPICMAGIMSVEAARAKVNLHLEVLYRRDDGFHEIVTLMTQAEMHDLLQLENTVKKVSPSVRLVNRGGACSELIDSLPQEDNLVVKAALLYLERAQIDEEVTLGITKSIPAGGGLGGGSSDAAATLRLLNRHYGKYTPEELINIAATIGSDVPFCLRGDTLFATGRGEKLHMTSYRPTGKLLLLFPGIQIHTGEAYRSLKAPGEKEYRGPNTAERVSILRNRLEQGIDRQSMASLFQNDFESALFKKYPILAEVRDELENSGALLARMTGSGSTIFGIFEDERIARSVKMNLQSRVQRIVFTEFAV